MDNRTKEKIKKLLDRLVVETLLNDDNIEELASEAMSILKLKEDYNQKDEKTKQTVEILKSKLNFNDLITKILKLNKKQQSSLLELVKRLIDENMLKKLVYDEIDTLFEYGSFFMQGNGMEEFSDELTPLSDYLICGIVSLLMEDSRISSQFKHNMI